MDIIDRVDNLARHPSEAPYVGDVYSGGVIVLDGKFNAAQLQVILEELGSGWISVEDRLPEGPDTVLVSSVYKGRRQPIEIAEYSPASSDLWYTTDREGWPIKGVTHWMPLPESPEEDPRIAAGRSLVEAGKAIKGKLRR